VIGAGVTCDDRTISIVRVGVSIAVVVDAVFTDLVCALEHLVVVVVAVLPATAIIDLTVQIEIGQESSLAGPGGAALSRGARISIVTVGAGDRQLLTGPVDTGSLRAGVLGVSALRRRARALPSRAHIRPGARIGVIARVAVVPGPGEGVLGGVAHGAGALGIGLACAPADTVNEAAPRRDVGLTAPVLAYVQGAWHSVVLTVHVDAHADPVEALVIVGAQIAVIARRSIRAIGRGDVRLRFGDVRLARARVCPREWVYEAGVAP